MNLQPDEKRQHFAAFVREHQAALRSFLRVIGVKAEAVDDLAQETFLVAFQELERFDEDRDFGKWLRGIARNLTRNERRKSANRRRILYGELTEHLIAEAEAHSPEQWQDDHRLRSLRDCVEQLPERSRKLLTGRYTHEWKSPLLADEFNMSAAAVRLTLMRIRRQLKICIETRASNA